MIIGDLELVLRVAVNAPKTELLQALDGAANGGRLRTGTAEIDVGGFVGRAVPVAAALGARVAICAGVPDPIPRQLQSFFDTYNVDTQFVTKIPATCPRHIRFECANDQKVLLDTATLTLQILDSLPAVAEADAIVVDLGESICQPGARYQLNRWLMNGTPTATIGFRVDRRWSRDDLQLARDARTWTFVRDSDARALAGQSDVTSHTARDESALLACMKELEAARLVIQRGPRGAVLLNGVPRPYHVHACPLDSGGQSGAGATLQTVTTLSSAAGSDDRTSLRRGVAAATGQVAGLPLPKSLEELDAGAAIC